jgi:predicted extracellular nuclease
VQDVVNGLNLAVGAGTYAFVDDGGATRQAGNGDAIHCVILYKTGRLQPVGPALLALGGPFERPPLAQVFATRPAPGTVPADTFALIANHFKSKASGSGANADQGDGQGPSNLRRKQQAAALLQFISSTVVPAGNGRVLTVGDYNAAFEEDPMDVLRAGGLVPGTGPLSTSYVFNGQRSALDHALYMPALAGRAEVLRWGINGEEPAFLDYAAAGPATDTTSAFRTSDHDPILIGLTLHGRPTATARSAGAGPDFQLFPNPCAGGRLTVRAATPALAQTPLQVRDGLGRLLLALPATTATTTERVIDLGGFGPGLYWLTLSGAVRPLVVE